jgi:uncharacterized protein YdaU (DUF1376 family)/uncharacterized protein YegP (UPF0339 family)
MAKDPAFLFYPNDWIGGTMGMTFEEKGAYMELLMMQFNRGHMTTHMVGQVVGQLWDKIKDKFIQDEQGMWFNRRLEEEKEKRQKFTQSRRNNISGENQHTKNKKLTTTSERSYDQHMTTHMEDVNVNVNEIDYFFNSLIFIENWKTWKDYKKNQFKFNFKSKNSEQIAINHLIKLSEKKEQNAIDIINQSIANGWKGFFQLKTNQNGKTITTPEDKFNAYVEYANRWNPESNPKQNNL